MIDKNTILWICDLKIKLKKTSINFLSITYECNNTMVVLFIHYYLGLEIIFFHILPFHGRHKIII
jgi:hypothetical protein